MCVCYGSGEARIRQIRVCEGGKAGSKGVLNAGTISVGVPVGVGSGLESRYRYRLAMLPHYNRRDLETKKRTTRRNTGGK